MRTLASFIFTSLDGFYEGPNGELDWSIVDEEFNEFAVRQLDEADTLGFGRATFEHMAAYWPTEQAEANDPAITSRMNGEARLLDDAHRRELVRDHSSPRRGDRARTGDQGCCGRRIARDRQRSSDCQPRAGWRPRRAARHGLPDRARSGPVALRGSQEPRLPHAPSRQAVRLRQPRAYLPTVISPELSDEAGPLSRATALSSTSVGLCRPYQVSPQPRSRCVRAAIRRTRLRRAMCAKLIRSREIAREIRSLSTGPERDIAGQMPVPYGRDTPTGVQHGGGGYGDMSTAKNSTSARCW